MTGDSSSSLSLPFLPIYLKIFCKNLDSIIAVVSHIHIVSTVKCYVKGISQLSWTITFVTKARGECQIKMENLHSVVALVCHIYSLGLWVDFDSNRIVELQPTTTLSPHCY